jgi:two-component system nitrogen regulation sensor histidine kinase GlnL
MHYFSALVLIFTEEYVSQDALGVGVVKDNFHYELMLNAMKTALILVDEKLEISFVNDSALNLLETGESQLKERPFSDFFLEDSFKVERIVSSLKNGEDFTETEVQMCFKDGRCLMVDVNANVLIASNKPRVLVEILVVDKQRKITQESQQYAQQVAARELIRGLAHEIKNPLGGIRGAAQLLEKELPSIDQKEFTQMIIDQSDRLRNLVDRLLGPNSLPQKRWCNLHEIIEKVYSVMLADQSFELDIERDYDPSIPDVYVDPDMLQQAVLNIVRNAYQALRSAQTDKAIITLKTRVERQCVIKGSRQPLVAKISIIDNGPGIPPELKDTLFYPMVSSKKNGSGLGLSIAQTLTDHHNGKIDLESFPGYTEFSLYIPIGKPTSQKDSAL